MVLTSDPPNRVFEYTKDYPYIERVRDHTRVKSCPTSKKTIHEERSHSDIQTHKDKHDNRGTLLRMGSCFDYRIDERDTCHDQTRKENESRPTAIAEIVTLWNCFAFYGSPERPQSATQKWLNQSS